MCIRRCLSESQRKDTTSRGAIVDFRRLLWTLVDIMRKKLCKPADSLSLRWARMGLSCCRECGSGPSVGESCRVWVVVGGVYPWGQEVGPVYHLGFAYQSVFGLGDGGFVKFFFITDYLLFFFSYSLLSSVGSCPGVLCPGVQCAGLPCVGDLYSGVHARVRIELSEICR